MAEASGDSGAALPSQLSSLCTVQSSIENLMFPSSSTPCSPSELAMFKRIIASGCSIKSQQRGEPDLTETELCEELHAILCQRPGSFLMRFGKYLDGSDLEYFEHKSADDYEVGFRVKELRQNLQKTSRALSKAVKNRRYVRLEQLMNGSDYFSDEEMQRREPLLFEYYIGQFLSEEEKLKIGEGDNSEMKLSSMILKNMEVNQRAALLQEQRNREQGQFEESDCSSDEDTADDGDASVAFSPMELSKKPDTAAREKLMLRQEFLSAMQANFLEGRDKDFDYSKVDYDEQYDCLEIRERDSEDSYFDAEVPSWCQPDSHSNGGMEQGTDDGKDTTRLGEHDMETEETGTMST